MGVAQLLNRQRQQIVNHEAFTFDSAEAAERYTRTFGVGADEIGNIRWHRQHVAGLIFAE